MKSVNNNILVVPTSNFRFPISHFKACCQHDDIQCLMTAIAAADYLGIPYTTLRDWAQRGILPTVGVPHCRRWWFDRRDLDAAVEGWKEQKGF